MRELDQSLDSQREAKKFSLGYKIEALQQLVIQRYQSLTTISAISLAIVGIVLSSQGNLIENRTLAFVSGGIFICTAFVSLGRYLYLIRDDINGIVKKIKELPNKDWSKPLEEEEFKADYWPETLYVCLILGVLLFVLSIIHYPIQYINLKVSFNSIFLSTTGLVLNTIAAGILIIPNIRKTRNIDDDFIVSMDKKTGDYTQKKHLRERRLNVFGLILLALGFLLQLLGILI
ncbi:MAG: hypothetical protein WCF92_02040 [bacterium]